MSFIYVSVKDLAELTSEGETAEGTQSTGGWPGTVLRRGSTGSSVEQVQFWLSDLAQFDSSLVRVTVDGSYGAATERAVRAFQQKQSLTADGVVGQRTWNALYAAWVDAQSDLGGTAWPGTALRRGAAGMEVRLVQFWLRLAADWKLFRDAAEQLLAANPAGPSPKPGGVWPASALAPGSAGPAVLQVQKWLNIIAAADQTADFVPETGLFDTETQAALESYQLTAGLETLGVVDADTWESLRLAAQGLCRECQEG